MNERDMASTPAAVGKPQRVVVDASVAVTWHLQDEQDVDAALALLDQFAAGALELHAPDLIRYQVPSAITVATRGRAPRLTENQGREAIEEFQALRLTMVRDDAVVLDAYRLTRRYEIAFYDALYLACALTLDCPLVIADRRFYVRMQDLAVVVWLGDYMTRT